MHAATTFGSIALLLVVNADSENLMPDMSMPVAEEPTETLSESAESRGNSADGEPTSPAAEELVEGVWLDSFEEAQQQATDRGMAMLLHFEASWCGPCRRMDSQVLNTDAVRDYLGTKIIGVRIDADRYRSLIDRYRITTLPTELVIAPDGTEAARHIGAESLSNYLVRLQAAVGNQQVAATDKTEVDATAAAEPENTRSCLIKRRDGKMVGLGGFSPVALSERREWQSGHDEFVVTFEGVDYFLQTADEALQFAAEPRRFIPHLHGCDPVELQRARRAQTGVIELGAFYKGEVFFFASVENRARFQNNPTWYLRSGRHGDVSDRDEFPFLQSTIE